MPDSRAVKDHFGLDQAATVEKDRHVMRAKQAVAAVDGGSFRLVFAGGTALARAHKRVRRMSDDIDFKIVTPIEAARVSANQRRRQLGELRDRVTASLLAAGFPLDPTDPQQMRSRDANRYITDHLHYAQPEEGGQNLRPIIQTELTHVTLRQPALRLPVASFIAEAYGRPPEVPAIDCVSVTETAAESSSP
jgi:predicted nucleotidyltransferase component of viral defense system